MSLIATAPASSALRATSGEKVSAEIGSSVRSARPAIAGTSRVGLLLGRNRRAAARGHRAHVEHLEAGLGQREAVLDRLLAASRCALPRTSSRR